MWLNWKDSQRTVGAMRPVRTIWASDQGRFLEGWPPYRRLSHSLSRLPEQGSCMRPGHALLNEYVWGSRWMSLQQKYFQERLCPFPLLGCCFILLIFFTWNVLRFWTSLQHLYTFSAALHGGFLLLCHWVGRVWFQVFFPASILHCHESASDCRWPVFSSWPSKGRV